MGRLIGAALLLGSGLWIGLKAAGELGKRVRALDAWMDVLLSMENEMAFRLPDLPELLGTLANQAATPAGDVLEAVRGRLEELGLTSFAELWQEALSAHSGELNQGDIGTLSRLGNVLGRYGGEDQCRVIGLTRKELEIRREEARQERSRMGKARVAVGLAVGCFLTILLI